MGAAITSLLGLAAALVTFAVQSVVTAVRNILDRRKQKRAFAAQLASELDLAIGLVRAFKKSSEKLADGRTIEDEAFAFVMRYRSAYDARAEMPRMLVFTNRHSELGVLPGQLVARVFAVYAQFDRIAGTSRHFWDRFCEEQANPTEVKYFANYMPTVYDAFLATADGVVEDLLAEAHGDLGKSDFAFKPILNTDVADSIADKIARDAEASSD